MNKEFPEYPDSTDCWMCAPFTNCHCPEIVTALLFFVRAIVWLFSLPN